MTKAAVDEIDAQRWLDHGQNRGGGGRDEGDGKVVEITASVAEETKLVIEIELETVLLVKSDAAPGVK